MELTRENTPNRLMGESLATVEFDLNRTDITAPTFALNSQELWSKLDMQGERFTVNDKYNAFNADPFFNARMANMVSPSRKAVENQINYIDNKLYANSGAKFGAYNPRFSSNLNVSIGRQILFTKKVSMGSEKYHITLLEAPSFATTKKLILNTRAEIKKEHIDKDILLAVDMSQKEALYNQKLAFADGKVSGIIAQWSDPQLNWGNFLTLAGATNMLRIMANVPMKYHNGAVAPIAIAFADIVSHARVFGGSSQDEEGNRIVASREEMIKKSIINTRRHYGNDNGLYRKSEYDDMNIKKHGCPCSLDEFAGDTIQDFYSEYNDFLYPASRLHNAKSISNEISASMPFIKSGKMRNFYRMKANSIDVCENLFGLDTKGIQRKITSSRTN